MNLSLNTGLTNSLIVLELLRSFNNDNFTGEVYVQSFNNCREMGLTFTMNWFRDKNEKLQFNKDAITFSVYEHRNSDSIIINGKKNWVGYSGELPYKDGDKWQSYASFSYNKHYEVAEWLFNYWKKEIDDFNNSEKVGVGNVLGTGTSQDSAPISEKPKVE